LERRFTFYFLISWNVLALLNVDVLVLFLQLCFLYDFWSQKAYYYLPPPKERLRDNICWVHRSTTMTSRKNTVALAALSADDDEEAEEDEELPVRKVSTKYNITCTAC
jgi:hypothetical protein